MIVVLRATWRWLSLWASTVYDCTVNRDLYDWRWPSLAELRWGWLVELVLVVDEELGRK